MRVVALFQARMGSTRLPDKVMKRIGGIPKIDLLLSRLARAKEVDQIVVATSVDDRNKPLVEHVKTLGYACEQGSENDVLDRYVQAALAHQADGVERDATIQALTAALESLRQQFLALQRSQFGASSERIEGQAELFAETVSLPLPPVQIETVTYDRERRGRPALPRNLPRVRVEYDLTEAEKNDCETVTRIGEDESETLDYIPAKLQVIEHVRAKYAATRKTDGSQTVVSAAMPPAPLPKSNASANLLSHVLASKFADHLPLNRIEGILERHGAAIASSTLSDWVLGSTELPAVIYEAMRAHVLAAPKIHAADTILPLCEQGRGRTVQARLWAYLGAGSTRANEQAEWIEHPAAVFYEFTDDRRGEHV